MPRNIPIALQSGDASTHCLLIRFDPVQPGYDPYFVTGLNRNVKYDDGAGEQTYLAAIGVQSSTMVSSADLSVDGGEASQLFPEFDTPISEADIAAGAYDFAQFTAYLVNYEDLTPGSHVVLGHGTTGRNTITDGGLAYVEELRGLAQALLQSLTEKWSLGCRATFGSQYLGTVGASVTEKYPCTFDAESLWEAGTIGEVGLETTRTLMTSGLSPPFGGVPGMIRFTSGANNGREYEVEEFEEDGGVQTIQLTFPTMFPMQVADTFEFRDDCPKDEDACKARGNWSFFRGESNIPVSDAGQIAVPGASAGVGTGATVTTEYQAE